MKKVKVIAIIVFVIVLMFIAEFTAIYIISKDKETITEVPENMVQFNTVQNENKFNVEENMQLNTTPVDIQTIKSVNPYTDFRCVNSSLIVGKKGNDWYEISNAECNNIIGVHNDKLYYVDYTGFAYIDLTKTTFEKEYWLKFNEEEELDDPYDYLTVFDAYIVGDDVYFMYNSQAGGALETDGILKINIKDTDIKNAKQFIKGFVDRWEIDVDNKILYYSLYVDNLSGDMYKYNLVTNENNKVLEKVGDFSIKADEIVYYTRNWDSGEISLYITDLNFQNTRFIATVSSRNNSSNNLTGWTAYVDGAFYYVDNPNIIKCVGNEKEVIYTIDNSNGRSAIQYFSIRVDGLMTISEAYNLGLSSSGGKKFLKDGIVYDSSTEFEDIPVFDVYMKDGTIKNITTKEFMYVDR